MAYYGSIEITDAKGWSMTTPVEKARLMAGSADFNDLVLPESHGGGVYPAHMQLFFTPGNPTRLRMVNLADTAMIAHRHLSENDIVIPAKGTLQFQTGDSLIVGDFLLKFYLHAQSGVKREARSEHLFMALELPRLELRTEDSLVGRLQVVNHGELANCQFEFDLEGIDDSCYNIDPAPLLFPGSCEFLKIRFFHRGDTPQAGPRPFTIRAYAPTSYPTEEVAISETLYVTPVYNYDVTIHDQSQVKIEMAAPEPLLQIPAPAQPAAKPQGPVHQSHTPAAVTNPAPVQLPAPQIPLASIAPSPTDASSPAVVVDPPPPTEASPPAFEPEAPDQTGPLAPDTSPETPVATVAPSEGQAADQPSSLQPTPQAPQEEAAPTPAAPEKIRLSPEIAQEIQPSAPTAAPQAPRPPEPPAPAREPIRITPTPENVIIEPPEQDLWAQEPSTIPRTTSATPVSRFGAVKKSSLLAGGNIEIISAQDDEDLDDQDESGQEEER